MLIELDVGDELTIKKFMGIDEYFVFIDGNGELAVVKK